MQVCSPCLNWLRSTIHVREIGPRTLHHGLSLCKGQLEPWVISFYVFFIFVELWKWSFNLSCKMFDRVSSRHCEEPNDVARSIFFQLLHVLTPMCKLSQDTLNMWCLINVDNLKTDNHVLFYIWGLICHNPLNSFDSTINIEKTFSTYLLLAKRALLCSSK